MVAWKFSSISTSPKDVAFPVLLGQKEKNKLEPHFACIFLCPRRLRIPSRKTATAAASISLLSPVFLLIRPSLKSQIHKFRWERHSREEREAGSERGREGKATGLGSSYPLATPSLRPYHEDAKTALINSPVTDTGKGHPSEATGASLFPRVSGEQNPASRYFQNIHLLKIRLAKSWEDSLGNLVRL